MLEAVTGNVHCLQKPPTAFELYYLANSDFDKADYDAKLLFKCAWKVPNRWTAHLFTTLELVPLSRFLRQVFSEQGFIPDIDSLPKIVKGYKQIELGEEMFSVYNNSRYGRHSYILASWVGNDGDIDRNCGLRPGRIRKIYVYKFMADDGEIYALPLTIMEWYKKHPEQNKFGRALDIYYKDFEQFGLSSFIPIPCVKSKHMEILM